MNNLEWPQVLPGAFAIVGTLVGGLITFGLQNRQRKQDRKEKRSALAYALAAEIEAYVDLMDRRDLLKTATHLLGVEDLSPAHLRGWLDDNERDAFPFFTASMKDVGILGPICGDIARFHTGVAAVKATLFSAEKGKFDDLNSDGIRRLIEGEIEIWKATLRDGRTIVGHLRELAR